MRRFMLPLILTSTLVLAACAPSQAGANPPSATAQSEVQPFDLAQGGPAPVSTASAAALDGVQASPELARSDQQGSVIVEVTPLNLSDQSDRLEFEVALNTHSIDLSMDLAVLATLTTDTGLAVQATLWDAPRGGHHVSGKLAFPAMKDGRSILEGAGKLTLTILSLDAPSRVFEWDLK